MLKEKKKRKGAEAEVELASNIIISTEYVASVSIVKQFRIQVAVEWSQ